MRGKAQDMKYRPSLMKYAEKYGVSRAGRSYNEARSTSTSGKPVGRHCGIALMPEQTPARHPRQHTEEEGKRFRDMRRRSPTLALPEL